MFRVVLISLILLVLLGCVKCYYVELTNNGPAVVAATVNFKAELFVNYNNKIQSDSSYEFRWKDNAMPPHQSKSNGLSTVSYFNASYTKPGEFEVEVTVLLETMLFMWPVASARQFFNVTLMLNGDLSIEQGNSTLGHNNLYVSSSSPVKHVIALNEPDSNYLKTNATSVLSYWFIDCVYYGVTDDLSFRMNYTNQSGQEKHIETLIIASYEQPTVPPPITTVPPSTTPIVPTTHSGNGTVSSTTANPVTTALTTTTTRPGGINLNKNSSSIVVNEVSKVVSPREFALVPEVHNNSDINNKTTDDKSHKTPYLIPNIFRNITLVPGKNYSGDHSFPYICINSSIIPPDAEKTYGYFQRKIAVRDPVVNITIGGTTWINQGDMLNLGVSCNGSGPYIKCVQMYPGGYNITGNESCETERVLTDCRFSIIHYFKKVETYTLVIIISNEVSKTITPVGVNIYEVMKHPQLSVIIVPVAFSSVAMILIVFGIAYYIQSRKRYTVEVADFDFAHTSDMEYKTFRERLRDAMSNAVNRTQDYVEEGNVWSPSRKYGSMQ